MKRVLFAVCLVLSMLGISYGAPLVENASQEQIALVKSAMPPDLTIEDGVVVESENHKNAYYIGVKFRGKGYKYSVVGLWLIGGGKHNPSLLYSINDKAFIYSQMKKASETKAAAYETDQESKLILERLNTN